MSAGPAGRQWQEFREKCGTWGVEVRDLRQGLGGSLEVGMGESGGKYNSQAKTRMAGQGALTVQGTTSSMMEPRFSRGMLGHPHDGDVRWGLP